MRRQLNVNQIYLRGMRKLILEALAAEKTKVDVLRGGNCGLLDEGAIVGKCARLSFLRMKGVLIEPPDISRELMFEAGHTSEDSWTSVLQAGWDGKILREQEVPIKWETSNNTFVTGRPDIVLASKEGELLHGIELKLVCSFNTATTVLGGKPKCLHLIQAGHYAWQLGFLPWDLWYTNRVDWGIKKMLAQAAKECPIDSPHVFYNAKTKKPEKINPFRVGFNLVWNEEEELCYLPDGTVDFTVSIVTPARMRAYYEFVSTMEVSKELGPRPTNMEANGEKGYYDICTYCPLQGVCNATESAGFDAWYSAAKEFGAEVQKQVDLMLAEESEFV